MECCILLVTILLWLFTFVNCEIVCNPKESGKKKCCINFKYMGGTCIECPKGSFGDDCTSQCPDGHYGENCNGICNCTDGQICDVYNGCLQNKTGDTMIIIETTSTEQQTTESNGHREGIIWNHLYGVPLGVAITALAILLVYTCRRRKAIDQEVDSRHDQQLQETESQAVQLNPNRMQSDYAEICETDPTYSHTITSSSDYNTLSFSRSRRNRSESSPADSHYDTSKNCLLKIKESKSESKQDAGGNPYSLAKRVMDTENKLQQSQVFEINEESVDLHPGICRRENIGP